MYPFDRAPVWRVSKVDIKAYAAELTVAEPLKSPTKLSALLTGMNAHAVNEIITALATGLSCKRRHAEATSDAQAERVSTSDLKTETEAEVNNHIRTTSIRD